MLKLFTLTVAVTQLVPLGFSIYQFAEFVGDGAWDEQTTSVIQWASGLLAQIVLVLFFVTLFVRQIQK